MKTLEPARVADWAAVTVKTLDPARAASGAIAEVDEWGAFQSRNAALLEALHSRFKVTVERHQDAVEALQRVVGVDDPDKCYVRAGKKALDTLERDVVWDLKQTFRQLVAMHECVTARLTALAVPGLTSVASGRRGAHVLHSPAATTARLDRYKAALAQLYASVRPPRNWSVACRRLAADDLGEYRADAIRQFLCRHGVTKRTFSP